MGQVPLYRAVCQIVEEWQDASGIMLSAQQPIKTCQAAHRAIHRHFAAESVAESTASLNHIFVADSSDALIAGLEENMGIGIIVVKCHRQNVIQR